MRRRSFLLRGGAVCTAVPVAGCLSPLLGGGGDGSGSGGGGGGDDDPVGSVLVDPSAYPADSRFEFSSVDVEGLPAVGPAADLNERLFEPYDSIDASDVGTAHVVYGVVLFTGSFDVEAVAAELEDLGSTEEGTYRDGTVYSLNGYFWLRSDAVAIAGTIGGRPALEAVVDAFDGAADTCRETGACADLLAVLGGGNVVGGRFGIDDRRFDARGAAFSVGESTTDTRVVVLPAGAVGTDAVREWTDREYFQPFEEVSVDRADGAAVVTGTVASADLDRFDPPWDAL